MAKKRPKSDFNMAEEVRRHLQVNPTLTGGEIHKLLTKEFPGRKISKSYCSVAVSNARVKLGISTDSSGRRKKKKAGRKKKSVRRMRPAAAAAQVDFAALQAAAQFVGQVGGADAAIEAVKQVQKLQVD